tara:strand:+ start:907 stop:1398 length:492 start_codon:yes stop_codon:yes gene_type:complete
MLCNLRKNGVDVFSGMVATTSGMFQLLDPSDTDGPMYGLTQQQAMVHLSQYDDCSWKPAHDRTDELAHQDAVTFTEVDVIQCPSHTQIAVGDQVKLCTSVRRNDLIIRERFTTLVMAVHSFEALAPPKLTVLPLVDAFRYLDWDALAPFSCTVDRALFCRPQL